VFCLLVVSVLAQAWLAMSRAWASVGRDARCRPLDVMVSRAEDVPPPLQQPQVLGIVGEVRRYAGVEFTDEPPGAANSLLLAKGFILRKPCSSVNSSVQSKPSPLANVSGLRWLPFCTDDAADVSGVDDRRCHGADSRTSGRTCPRNKH
jgi:hypothetical protein